MKRQIRASFRNSNWQKGPDKTETNKYWLNDGQDHINSGQKSFQKIKNQKIILSEIWKLTDGQNSRLYMANNQQRLQPNEHKKSKKTQELYC